jgi:hypothetical protein
MCVLSSGRCEGEVGKEELWACFELSYAELSGAYRSRQVRWTPLFCMHNTDLLLMYAQLCTIMRMGGIGQLDGWETPRDFAEVYGLEVGEATMHGVANSRFFFLYSLCL